MSWHLKKRMRSAALSGLSRHRGPARPAFGKRLEPRCELQGLPSSWESFPLSMEGCTGKMGKSQRSPWSPCADAWCGKCDSVTLDSGCRLGLIVAVGLACRRPRGCLRVGQGLPGSSPVKPEKEQCPSVLARSFAACACVSIPCVG